MFQIVTAFLISQKDSGYVESVRFPQRTLWCVSNLLVIGKFQRRHSLVFSVQMRVAHLNKQSMANGSTYFVQSGFLRRVLRTKSLWSLSLGLSVFQNNGGSSYVWTCASHTSLLISRVPRNARFVTSEKVHAFNAAKTRVF